MSKEYCDGLSNLANKVDPRGQQYTTKSYQRLLLCDVIIYYYLVLFP